MARPAAAAAARSTPSTSQRALTRGQYVGRNGEVLIRAEVSGIDQYDVPVHLKEEGWDYQWMTESVTGNKDIVRRDNNVMYQNGWRPVQATGRWQGVFFPPDFSAHIVIGECGLYERPLQMSLDARDEDISRAKQQVADRDAALMGGKANVRDSIAPGFEMSKRYRGTGGDLRMSIDPGLDAPRPSLPLAEPGE